MDGISLVYGLISLPESLHAHRLCPGYAPRNHQAVLPDQKACQDHGIDYTLIHTNQHYSSNMDACFFEELALPAAHFNLGVGGCSPASQVGRMLVALDPLLNDLKPDHVVVQGDANSALAGGLAASKAGFSVAHVEAGLRSFDLSMPEENNRVPLDHLASHWFCPAER